MFEDDVPFPQVGYVSSLEGIKQFDTRTSQVVFSIDFWTVKSILSFISFLLK